MLLADINSRYWKLYESRVIWIEKIFRLLTGVSAVLSVLAWALKDEYLPVATAMSAFTAFVVVVIIPSVGLDGYSSKIMAIKQSWIDLRNDYEDLWEDLESAKSAAWKRRWKSAQNKDLEMEKGGVWTPTNKNILEKAQTDNEDLYVPKFSV